MLDSDNCEGYLGIRVRIMHAVSLLEAHLPSSTRRRDDSAARHTDAFNVPGYGDATGSNVRPSIGASCVRPAQVRIKVNNRYQTSLHDRAAALSGIAKGEKARLARGEKKCLHCNSQRPGTWISPLANESPVLPWE